MAADCGINRDILGASYRIEQQSAAGGEPRVESLILWRMHSEVAHERPEHGYTDIWRNLGVGDIERRRISDRRRRLIVSETVADAGWSSKYQLLSRDALNKMTRMGTSGEACQRVEKYQTELASGVLTVWWNPSLQLVLLLQRESAGSSTTMKLIGIEAAGPVVAGAFNRRLAYLPDRLRLLSQ